jgi:hypothetical protein
MQFLRKPPVIVALMASAEELGDHRSRIAAAEIISACNAPRRHNDTTKIQLPSSVVSSCHRG